MPAIRFASHRQVAEQASLRPPRYLLDLEQIIVRRDEHGIWYDAARPAFLELVRKYRPAPRAPRPASGLSTPEAHWQDWREEGGRWVPDGWIKPGYFADPPAFEPQQGETLSTPGFKASAFTPSPRHPLTPSSVDVVIPLGTGSRHGDAELRYCLRSIERHLEAVGRIWIIGHRPGWLKDAEENTNSHLSALISGDQCSPSLRHLPFDDSHRSKDINIIKKIEAACRAGVSERFVFWSDDQLLLRPLAFSQLGPYTWGDLRGRPIGPDPKRWYRRLRRTSAWLAERGLSTFHCDTHVPVPMERDRFLELADRTRDMWSSRDGMCVNTWYGNQAGPDPQPMGNRKATLEGFLRTAEIRGRVAGRWFLGHNDAGFTRELRALLEELFPEKCRWEEEEEENANPHLSALISVDQCSPSLCVKAAGPTLSIIIPTIGRPTLKRTLDSIRAQQLVAGDEVLVVQDGLPEEATRRVFEESGLPGRYLVTGERSGNCGHSPRKMAMPLARAQYLAFMDDDDFYTPGAFGAIRRAIERQPGRPLMFRMVRPGWAPTIWQAQVVRLGNVSSVMAVVPNHLEKLGEWGDYRAGDLAFVVTTLEKWPVGSLVWSPEIIAVVPQAGSTDARGAAVTKNLIYHVYAHAGNREWRANVDRLKRSWHRFNGRKIISIVTDAETVDVAAVQRAFPRDPAVEWLVQPNDPARGEAVTFVPAAQSLRTFNLLEATFYAHAKGTSPRFQAHDSAMLPSIRLWREFLYRHCLDTPTNLDSLLLHHAAVGCARNQSGFRREESCPPCYWHFAGTFWWINHARFFGHPEALALGPSRWALERHLGEIIPVDETYCTAGDHFPNTGVYAWTEADWEKISAK